MPIVKEKFTDIWKRREPLYLKEKKIPHIGVKQAVFPLVIIRVS